MKDTWEFVSKTIEAMKKNDDLFTKTIDQLMINYESPIVDPCWSFQSLLIDSLRRLVNDEGKWINYYVYECDYGRDPKEAGIEGNMRLIDSIENLKWIINLEA